MHPDRVNETLALEKDVAKPVNGSWHQQQQQRFVVFWFNSGRPAEVLYTRIKEILFPSRVKRG
jgi:hypothetical protein